MRALSTAATGMNAQNTNVDVIANNLANVTTTGFKRSRALFQDLFYQYLRQPGSLNGLGQTNPTGIQVGLGVRLATTMDIFEEGELENTGRDLDLAIRGRGFFPVKIYSDIAEGIGYTRDGHLIVDSEGNLVLGGPDGFLLEPPISVPTDATSIEITADGQVNATIPGSITPQQVGVIQLANFTNPEGMLKIGSNIYVKSASSGEPTLSSPGTGGAGLLVAGYLEKSNVDPVRELVQLIEAQRAFELNGRVIESADQMLQTVNTLRM